jgi:hypothetical protein
VGGIERIRAAVTKHGKYSRATKIERQYYRELVKKGRKLLACIKKAAKRGRPGTDGEFKNFRRRRSVRQQKNARVSPNTAAFDLANRQGPPWSGT